MIGTLLFSPLLFFVHVVKESAKIRLNGHENLKQRKIRIFVVFAHRCICYSIYILINSPLRLDGCGYGSSIRSNSP